MDLNQTKLTKTEWNSTEIPVSTEEKQILKLICDGYHNVNLIYNNNLSIIGYTKLDNNDEMHNHLYKVYFEEQVKNLNKKYEIPFEIKIKDKKSLKSGEKMKIENVNKDIQNAGPKIFEYYLLHNVERVMKYYYKDNMDKFYLHYYSLYNLINYHISNINIHIEKYVNFVLDFYKDDIDMSNMYEKIYSIIENNTLLLGYNDIKLYSHQKQLYTICKQQNPKLVLYTAPTGTGKTMSPLGLSENNKIIFVCAARHVGLALAKSAISMQKKVAFAFGCKSSEDIRLHYYAGSTFIKNQATGKEIKYKDGTRKIDNSDGRKVDIMICDIKSYLCAMYYMQAFNDLDNVIMYWDEPTITMDYETHDHHESIHKIWNDNKVPNVILSSATLPSQDEIEEVISDFRGKFENSMVHNIVSHDCNKSIPLLNKDNFVEMPHYMCKEYDDMIECVNHCESYLTLMRYYDLEEIVKFVKYACENNFINTDRYKLENYYTDVSDLEMNKIKIHYIEILKHIKKENYNDIYNYFQKNRKPKYTSSIHISTSDAHTLTDGPTIFLADNVDKIAKFILSESKIPQKVMTNIMEAINFNNALTKKIYDLEKKLEDSLGAENEKENKMADMRISPELKELQKQIDTLRGMVKSTSLNDVFIPNTIDHLKYWSEKKERSNEFSSKIEEDTVEKIMLLDIDSMWKILLLMGIGVFTTHKDDKYTEIMKELANKQLLYMIVASSDYIYGTNYQFTHGYLSKDLNNMTQEKTIQSLGRIGRNNIQKSYSIRFRNDDLIKKIMKRDENKPEVVNMNRLFTTDIE